MAEKRKTAMAPIPTDVDLAARQVSYETGVDKKDVIASLLSHNIEMMNKPASSKNAKELAKDVQAANNAPLSWADVFMARTLQEEERAKRQDERMDMLLQMYMVQMLSESKSSKGSDNEDILKTFLETQDKDMDRLVQVMLTKNNDEQQALYQTFTDQQQMQAQNQQEFMGNVSQIVEKLTDRISNVMEKMSSSGQSTIAPSGSTADDILRRLDEIVQIKEKVDGMINRYAQKTGVSQEEIKEESGVDKIDKIMTIVDGLRSRLVEPLLSSAPAPPPPREMLELEASRKKDLESKVKSKKEQIEKRSGKGE